MSHKAEYHAYDSLDGLQDMTESGLPASDCSRLSDTPETDELCFWVPDYTKEHAMFLRQHAKKLERERDQARAEAMKWRERWAEDTPTEEIGCTLPSWLRNSSENTKEQAR